MREPTYYLLLALAKEPLYGYAIAKEAQRLSDGRVKLTAGTLYGALDRLQAKSLVEVDREEVVEGRRRRYYRITEDGRSGLLGEIQRLRDAVSAADDLGGADGLGGLGGLGGVQ